MSNKFFFVILFFITTVYGEETLVSVKFVETLYFRGMYTWTYESFIKSSDQEAFDQSNASDKQKYLQGMSILSYYNYSDSSAYTRKGCMQDGRVIGEWYEYDHNNNLVCIKLYNDRSECIKTRHPKHVPEKSTRDYPDWIETCFGDYLVGLQPPTLFDAAYPTGFTLSSLNFHFDIVPFPRIAGHRPQAVAAAEIGRNGYALRAGISPFNSEMGEGFISFTPLTINTSFTYLWRDNSYDKFYDPEPYRWHIGVDADFSLIFGHIRLGAFRLMDTVDRPWHFMFSIGASPAIPVVPFVSL